MRFWILTRRKHETYRFFIHNDNLHPRSFRWLTLKTAPAPAAWDLRLARSNIAAAFGLALACAVSSVPVRAAFEAPFLTAQSAAMGGASLAASGDPAALFVNPGGVGGMLTPEAYLTYDSLFTGMSGVGAMGEGFMAAGCPVGQGSLAFGAGLFNAAGLTRERTLSVGYAVSLWDGFHVGLAGKQLYHDFAVGGDPLAAQDPVFRNGSSKSAYAFDIGGSAEINRALLVGVAIRNINQPDVGLASPDRVPREVQAGLSFKALGVTTTGDVSLLSQDSRAGRAVPALGVEKALAEDRVAFRLGVTPTQFSSGVGVRFGRMGFDYALVFDRELTQGNMGSHRVGLRIPFGGSR